MERFRKRLIKAEIIMQLFLNRLLTAVVFALIATPAFAQKENQRYEVGRRLIKFEVDFEGIKDPLILKGISERLKPLTFYFFSGQLDQCSKALDLARWNCKNQGDPSGIRTFADSLSITSSRKIIELKEKLIECEIASVYPTKEKGLLKGRLYFSQIDGKEIRELALLSIEQLPHKVSADIQGLKEGDYQLVLELSSGEKIVASHKVLISLIEDKSRLITEMGATKLKKDAPFWEAGKQNLTGLLNELLMCKKFEGDMPVKRLVESMGFLEKGLDAVDDKKGSEYLVAFPGRVAPLPVRIFIPACAKVAKVPLVVALHGAGATENMFFEAYGVGKVKTLCHERGWMLVAPRNGITADNLRMLIQELPIDPEQVVFIGHSMGASQALGFALNHSKEVKALGLMGGAGSIGKNQSLGNMPVFVGVGSEDFARASVVKFSQEAMKQPENKLVFKEYESIDHSSICQVCLPEMFDFSSMSLKK